MAAVARTIQIGPLTSVFLLLAASAWAQPQAASTPLVHYSFDDDLVESGPDTFSVFQFGKGSVTLNSVQRFSGYRSVELRDVPGDHTFPELQGYFPLRAKGK